MVSSKNEFWVLSTFFCKVFDQVMMAGLQKIDEVKNNKANENKKKCFIF